MRIIICDDDNLIVEKIQKYIRQYFTKIHIKCPDLVCYNCGEDLLNDPLEKDIVFLDIELPGVDGVFVGNKLKNTNRNTIIFVITSFSEYLDDAMRFHVFRYLSKPLDKQRFFRNLSDAMDLYNNSSLKIAVETKGGIYSIPAASIIAVECINRKVTVHTLQGDFESTKKMAFWEKALPQNLFFQTHRSFIINLSHVNDFDHMLIHLADGKVDAYLTRRMYKDFKERYLLYLESTR